MIKTSRLVLRPPLLTDELWLQEIMEQTEVNANTLVINSPCPAGFAKTWLVAANRDQEKGNAINFVVIKADDNKPIGLVFLLVNANHLNAELGYFFHSSFWNQGFASEASYALLDFGFKQHLLNRIFAVHFQTNPASGKVMQKLSMTYEGCRRQHVIKCGQFVDIVQYGILRSEFID